MAEKAQGNNAIFASKNAIVDGNNLWMLSNDTDVLLHFDFSGLRLMDYHILPGDELLQYAHMGMVKNGDIIYIVPYAGDDLVLFDCKSAEMRSISISYEEGEIKRKDKFCIAAVWKTQLFLIGHSVKGIFCYDVPSGRFARDTSFLKELEKAGCDITTTLFSDCCYQKRDKLYLPVFCANLVLEIDLDKGQNRIYKLNSEKKIELRTIDGYEEGGKEKFLLTTVNDEMLIWSPLDGVEEMRELGLLRNRKGMYSRAFHVGKKNYYIAAGERKVFVEEDNRIEELEFEYENSGGAKEGANGTQFEAVFRNGTDIFFQARSNGQLFKIDTITDMVHRMDFDVTIEKRKEIRDQVYSSRPIADMLIENTWLGLDGFLKMYVGREGKW